MKFLYLVAFCFLLVDFCDCGNGHSSPEKTTAPKKPKKTATNSLLRQATTIRQDSFGSIKRAATLVSKAATNVRNFVAKAIKTKKFENVGGHAGVISEVTEKIVDKNKNEIPVGALVKDANDKQGYERLAVPKVRDDPHLVGLVPQYYAVMEVPDGEDANGETKYKTVFGMENVLKGIGRKSFDPDTGVLIDIKFGNRSFLTNDLDDNNKDWMNKFIDFGLVETDHDSSKTKKGKCLATCAHSHPPSAKVVSILQEIQDTDKITIPFPAGRTKIEGQTLRDQLNSMFRLGFRITASKVRNVKKGDDCEEYNFLRKEEDVLAELDKLLAQCQVKKEANPERKPARQLLWEILEKALPKLKASKFFATHETPGSSGYVICDKNHLDFRFFDWGKSVEVGVGVPDHVSMWIPGKNRADGYFTGVQNLVKLLKEGWIYNRPKK